MQPQPTPLIPTLGSDDQPIFLRPTRYEAIRTLVTGLFVGLFVPALGQWLASFFIKPVFCSSGDPISLCSGNQDVGYGVAVVLLSVGAVVLLANWQVFRPLTIVVAALISLWGLQDYLHSINTYNGLLYALISALLFGITYLLFYWLMRVHNFVVSVGLVIIAIILVRLMLIQ